jgi:hypothetical protein
MEKLWNDTDREELKYLEIKPVRLPLSANPTWTKMVTNPGLHGPKPVITARSTAWLPKEIIKRSATGKPRKANSHITCCVAKDLDCVFPS